MTTDDTDWSNQFGAGETRMGFRDEPPAEIGGWRIHSLRGEGGFGRVYLAYKNNCQAAVKVLRPDYVEQPNAAAFRKSFESEVEILSRLKGDYTAGLIEADLDGYLPWIATKFVSGHTLSNQVKYGDPVRGNAWWLLTHAVFSGLAEAHELGIVHRDVKPSNVMRSIDIPAVLIDFGIARLLETHAEWDRAGTDSFSSPEQRRGDPLTPASDVYSAALTLLYASTRPRSAVREEFTRHEPPGVPFVEDVFDRSSPEAVLLRDALSTRPEARPSAEEMLVMSRTLCPDPYLLRARDIPVRFNLAVPRSVAPPEPHDSEFVMRRALPEDTFPSSSHEKFYLAVPSSAPQRFGRQERTNTVGWEVVTKAVRRLVSVGPGQVAQLVFEEAEVEVNVFGLSTPYVLIEMRVPYDTESSRLDEVEKLGWAPPVNHVKQNWLLNVPGGKDVVTTVSNAVLNAVRDALGITPEKPRLP